MSCFVLLHMIEFKDSSLKKWNNGFQSGPYKEEMSKDEEYIHTYIHTKTDTIMIRIVIPPKCKQKQKQKQKASLRKGRRTRGAKGIITILKYIIGFFLEDRRTVIDLS